VLLYRENFKSLITKPLVLVGVMGSGKSTIGKKLARKLQLQFYDSDKVIEDRNGLSVFDIHEFRGTDYFRTQERQIIKEIISYGPIVLSTGGSSLLQDEIRTLIKASAISIWLSVNVDVLHNRVSRRNTRPELNISDKKTALEEMIVKMDPIYQEADIVVESSEDNAHYIVDTIISKLVKHLTV
jgi:shikimate kinase